MKVINLKTEYLKNPLGLDIVHGLRTVAFVADYDEYATDVAEFWQCGMPTFVSHGTLTVWNGSVRLERNYTAILKRNDERGHVHGRPGKTCRMMLS